MSHPNKIRQPDASHQHIGCPANRAARTVQDQSAASNPSSHLEMARVRAFQAGVLPAKQFVDFSGGSPQSLLLPNSESDTKNASSLLKPTRVFSERLYAAASKPVPEFVFENLRLEGNEEQEQSKEQQEQRQRNVEGRTRKIRSSRVPCQEQTITDDEEANDCQSRRHRSWRLVVFLFLFSRSSLSHCSNLLAAQF